MPDAFGNETPQEALGRVRATFRENNQRFQNSGMSNSKGAQAGQALANIFGGITKKALDTRAGRKSEAERLAGFGLSTVEARELARKNVPFSHKEVQKAKMIKRFSAEADERVEELSNAEGYTPELARAGGMLVMASKLREAGFTQEATNMTMQAGQIRTAEQTRIAELENLNARTGASQASTLKTLDDITNANDTQMTRLVESSEILTAQIENSDNPSEIAKYERMRGRIDARIAKLNTITGTTENDPSALSRAGKNAMVKELIDLKVLDSQLGELQNTLINSEGDLAASLWGRMTESALGAAEVYLNRTPTESEEAFLERVRANQSEPALLSADIRHALTGAAMSPAEAVFLEPFLPIPGESRSIMLSKVMAIRKYTQLDIATRSALLEGASQSAERFMNNLISQSKAEVSAGRRADTSDAPVADTTDADVLKALEVIDSMGGNR